MHTYLHACNAVCIGAKIHASDGGYIDTDLPAYHVGYVEISVNIQYGLSRHFSIDDSVPAYCTGYVDASQSAHHPGYL
jgi:hypothetical protein